MFCHFGENFENSKWPPFLGRGNFFEIAKSTLLGYPVGRKFRRNRSICHTVKEIEANSCFVILGKKFENSKWPPFLGRGKFFENCKDYIAQTSCGLKISTKSLYLARLRR